MCYEANVNSMTIHVDGVDSCGNVKTSVISMEEVLENLHFKIWDTLHNYKDIVLNNYTGDENEWTFQSMCSEEQYMDSLEDVFAERIKDILLNSLEDISGFKVSEDL